MTSSFQTAKYCRTACLSALLIACVASAAQSQSASQTQSLSFGPFAAGSGGTVSITPAGARTSTGGVTLLTNAQFGIFRSASFSVTNTTNGINTFTITLPTSATLTRTGGSETMTVDAFTSTPAPGTANGRRGFGTLSNAGTATFAVGARLNVGASQAGGSYAGTYTVTVTYP